MLGLPMRERADFVARDAKAIAPPTRVHRGWSWMCGCVAFARDEEDRYLYVPCVGHTGLSRSPVNRRAPDARDGSSD